MQKTLKFGGLILTAVLVASIVAALNITAMYTAAVSAITKFGLGGNAAEEAFYYTGYTDSSGKTMSGGNNYIIHFTPAQVKNPPANPGGFWSITAYNSTNRLVPNPINRYTILLSNPALKNPDGSVDIYVQPQSPGQAKQNNWLPSPTSASTPGGRDSQSELPSNSRDTDVSYYPLFILSA